LTAWVVPLGLLAGSLVLIYTLRALLYRWMAQRSRRTETRLDDVLVAATRWPSHLWVVIISVLIAINTVNLPGTLDGTVRRLLLSLLVLSFTIAAARLVVGIVNEYSTRWSPELALATTGVTQTIVQVVVVLIGLLILLSTLGINIAPLLGALGVGGLAVGLALQPTLSNLFAGFQIAVARQIRPGQRVRLDSGQEGYVTDINWRTTTLRTPDNHFVIIPNAKLAESIVTNYDMPDGPVNITLRIGVAYDSDTQSVERALRDEVVRVRDQRPEFVRDFEPIVRFDSFGDYSLGFVIVMRLQTYDAQFAVRGELHHRLLERLRREGVEIPVPERTVHLREERRGAEGGGKRER
jgi:small-conductance mechanosensitive channel